MTNQELCMFLDFVVATIEAGQTDKALEILKRRIAQIDRKEAQKNSKKDNKE